MVWDSLPGEEIGEEAHSEEMEDFLSEEMGEDLYSEEAEEICLVKRCKKKCLWSWIDASFEEMVEGTVV
jgi:hypothetical protein